MIYNVSMSFDSLVDAIKNHAECRSVRSENYSSHHARLDSERTKYPLSIEYLNNTSLTPLRIFMPKAKVLLEYGELQKTLGYVHDEIEPLAAKLTYRWTNVGSYQIYVRIIDLTRMKMLLSRDRNFTLQTNYIEYEIAFGGDRDTPTFRQFEKTIIGIMESLS